MCLSLFGHFGDNLHLPFAGRADKGIYFKNRFLTTSATRKNFVRAIERAILSSALFRKVVGDSTTKYFVTEHTGSPQVWSIYKPLFLREVLTQLTTTGDNWQIGRRSLR